MAVNCDCNDVTGYRTLAQLRSTIMERLGFADPMANISTRTLAQLRTDLHVRMGWAAIAGVYAPGMSDLLDSFINEAQQTLFRRLELDKGAAALPARMTADGDVTTLDYMAVFNLALALAKSHHGKADAKVYFEITEQYIADTAKRRPPNAVAVITGILQDAQRQIIRRYPAVRMDRWFSWSLTAGENHYDIDADTQDPEDGACTKQVDTLAIKEVSVTRGSAWTPLRKGIPSTVLGYETTGYPTHYDIKQCIEVWPTPSATEGTLRIRAGFLPTVFAADIDTPSIDDELVFLLALANAKAHPWPKPFGAQADANNVIQQFEVHLQGVVAGSHATARYVPGHDRNADLVYVEPVPTVPFA